MTAPEYPVVPRDDPSQAELFHYSPQHVCDEIGLTWHAATQLHQSGWITFDPQQVVEMDEGQERELRFVGALAAGGCDDRMLHRMLSHLQAPYYYSLGGIYFDWANGGRWRVIPSIEEERQDMFSEWIEDLSQEEDVEVLSDLRDQIDTAIEELAGPGE